MAEAADSAAETSSEQNDAANATTSQQALDMLTGTPTTAPAPETETPVEAEQHEPTSPETDDESVELGDAGKRALERMKSERNSAIRGQRKAEQQLAEAKQTIRQLRIEKLSAGRLRDPDLAFKLLDDLKGDEDDKAIVKALDKLVAAHPYLAPETAPSPQTARDPDSVEALFPDLSQPLKPSDQHRVTASQFGGILEQLGINI